MQYCEMSKEELLKLKEELDETYKEAQSKGLSLNMSRGKPSATQLNITMDMLDTINSSSDMKSEDGTDCRNYGVLDGIPEAKKLMADIMGTTPEPVSYTHLLVERFELWSFLKLLVIRIWYLWQEIFQNRLRVRWNIQDRLRSALFVSHERCV